MLLLLLLLLLAAFSGCWIMKEAIIDQFFRVPIISIRARQFRKLSWGVELCVFPLFSRISNLEFIWSCIFAAESAAGHGCQSGPFGLVGAGGAARDRAAHGAARSGESAISHASVVIAQPTELPGVARLRDNYGTMMRIIMILKSV